MLTADSASVNSVNTGPPIPRSQHELDTARKMVNVDDVDLPLQAGELADDDSNNQKPAARDDPDSVDPLPHSEDTQDDIHHAEPWQTSTPKSPMNNPLPAVIVIPQRPPQKSYDSTPDFITFSDDELIDPDDNVDSIIDLDTPSTPLSCSPSGKEVDDTFNQTPGGTGLEYSLSNYRLQVMHPLTPSANEPVSEIINVRRDHPLQWHLWQQPQYAPKKDVALLQLTRILEERGCPHIMFEEILEWVEKLIEHEVLKHGTDPDVIRKTKRKTFVNRIMKLYPTPGFTWQIIAMETKNTKDILHGNICFLSEAHSKEYLDRLNKFERMNRDCVWVPKTDFAAQLISLLSDRSLFGNLDNLLLNRTNIPQSLYEPYATSDNDRLDDVLSGSWYADTVRRMHLGKNDFLMPIILYMDKTGTDAYQRYGLEPVIFSVGILNRSCRNKSGSWRLLGFIPDLELRSKAEKNRDRSSKMKGTSNRNYQHILTVILESLSKYQRTGIPHQLNLGDYRKAVTIWPKVCLVMGDAKSGDCLTGRYGTHHQKVRRQSRHCLTMYNDLDIPGHTCR